ncbi:MAG: hypothetical protein ACK5V5_09370 [Cyclobacteriaceae bacterium]|jgi:hypothetical protein|nr:hypothetical protein [Flammeovirgaceae bacterium]
MIQRRIIILILAAGTFCCKPTSNQEDVLTTDSLNNDTTSIVNKIENEVSNHNSQLAKDFDKFEMIFEFENTDQQLKQRLGVTWLTNDSIEFRLLSQDDICDTNYWGTAKDNYSDMDPESDEDENGESYPASEYVAEEETYSLQIRISLDKDIARIVYTHKIEEATDCIPQPNLVLVKKNAR